MRLQIIAFLFDLDCACGVLAGQLEKSEGPKVLDSGYGLSETRKEQTFLGLVSVRFWGVWCRLELLILLLKGKSAIFFNFGIRK